MDRVDPAQAKVKTNINQLKERFRSKNELYRFLALECGAFLPKRESTNVYFLKDIMMGKKDVSPFH